MSVVFDALRQISANDEICQDAAITSSALHHGLDAQSRALARLSMCSGHAAPRSHAATDALHTPRHYIAMLQDEEESALDVSPYSRLLKSSTSFLRQLTSSDAVKASFVDHDGIGAAKDGLVYCNSVAALSRDSVIPLNAVQIAEQYLGLVANVTLRHPDISLILVEKGCVEEIVHCMVMLLGMMSSWSVVPANTIKKESSVSTKDLKYVAFAMRQGCMAVRNMAVRCAEAREEFLRDDFGVEELLRMIKKSAPNVCGDVGSAALRDLGLDDYNC